MEEKLIISKKVDKELKKIRTFWENKITEFHNKNNDLITIFVIKSEKINFWKIGKNDKVVNIFFCKDFELEELIKIFS